MRRDAGNLPPVLKPRVRSLLATTAVAALVAFGLCAHGHRHVSHEGLVGATAGFCVLLAITLQFAGAPKPEVPEPAVVIQVAPTYHDLLSPRLLDRRARASPSTLQRFRN